MENVKKSIQQALKSHGVIAFPTETVMGLGVYFDDEIALNKLNQIKGRPDNKPYTLMLFDKKDIGKFANISEKARKIIEKYMPGELTILLPIKKGLPKWLDYNTGKIGIRIPNHSISLKVLKAAGKGLLVPSANKSGQKPALNSNEIYKIFGNCIDFVVEGHADSGVPSTIIDLTTEKPIIIREGNIKSEELYKLLEEQL